jgi:hypothetical protein
MLGCQPDKHTINKPVRFLDKLLEINWRQDFDVTPDQFAIAVGTIQTYAKIEIICTTDRLTKIPIGERQMLGQPSLEQYYDLDGLAIPYVTEFDKAIERFHILNAIESDSNEITITNIIGTLTIQAV